MSAPMCGLPSPITVTPEEYLASAIVKLRWAVGGEFSASVSPQECEALLAKFARCERLEAALERLAGPSSFKPHDEAAALYQAEVEQIARDALAEGGV